MKMEGKISSFGGPDDTGMRYDEGLAFYEHREADLRTDLFLPRSADPFQGTSKRLRCHEAYYVALNVPNTFTRLIFQQSLWKIANLRTGIYAVCYLVDRGPGAKGRLVDASNKVLDVIGVNTDDEVEVSEVTPFQIPFGLYKK
jgi:hypothetical protein